MRFLFALLMAAIAQPALGDDGGTKPTTLEPVSPWSLDYAETHCRLSRLFGDKDHPTVFFLEQYYPDSTFRWVVGGPKVGNIASGAEVRFQFGPGAKISQLGYTKLDLGDFGKGFSTQGPEVTESEPLMIKDDGAKGDDQSKEPQSQAVAGIPHLKSEIGRSIDWLALEPNSGNEVRLSLGNMQKPFEAMNQCTENLASHFGVDVAAQKVRRKGPIWSNRMDVIPMLFAAHPLELPRGGPKATFTLILLIDANGKPTNCQMIPMTAESNNWDKELACKILARRASFEPAIGADGERQASFYGTQVSFVLR
ncbi:hypothetical protein [Tsuneonella mangrovi]|uniref:hypothetical protein n=1 Tax=Tsuneonella mangrovi TaxID=1982042 RepID=UPI000BA27B37|nr:hypothetical protein [Tsuneonella mangrovi]